LCFWDKLIAGKWFGVAAGVGAEQPECTQHDACGANRDRVFGGKASGLMIG